MANFYFYNSTDPTSIPCACAKKESNATSSYFGDEWQLKSLIEENAKLKQRLCDLESDLSRIPRVRVKSTKKLDSSYSMQNKRLLAKNRKNNRRYK